MPAPKKVTPERYCEYCGKRLERNHLPNGDLEYLIHFNRRKYCDRTCMAQAFDGRTPRTDTLFSSAHWHSRKAIAPGPCVHCGAPNALDVHHKNGDWHDHSEGNLERICRSCHNLEHRELKVCTICGKPQKGLGYCDKHYQRFKKYGDPLMFKRNQHTPLVRLAE